MENQPITSAMQIDRIGGISGALPCDHFRSFPPAYQQAGRHHNHPQDTDCKRQQTGKKAGA